MGAMLVGGIVAIAIAYEARHLSHGSHFGHGGIVSHAGYGHGKFKHGKFNNGKHGKHEEVWKAWKFKNWK